jgi:hypothetical protein
MWRPVAPFFVLVQQKCAQKIHHRRHKTWRQRHLPNELSRTPVTCHWSDDQWTSKHPWEIRTHFFASLVLSPTFLLPRSDMGPSPYTTTSNTVFGKHSYGYPTDTRNYSFGGYNPLNGDAVRAAVAGYIITLCQNSFSACLSSLHSRSRFLNRDENADVCNPDQMHAGAVFSRRTCTLQYSSSFGPQLWSKHTS